MSELSHQDFQRYLPPIESIKLLVCVDDVDKWWFGSGGGVGNCSIDHNWVHFAFTKAVE